MNVVLDNLLVIICLVAIWYMGLCVGKEEAMKEALAHGYAHRDFASQEIRWNEKEPRP